MDSQLTVAYEAALARDPSHANDVKQDEVDWLGERDREMWSLLESQRKFPSLPSELEAGLAYSYRLRIAFLNDIDNPDATRGMPVAQSLLKAAATLPARETNTLGVLGALEFAGTLVLPNEQSASDPKHAIALLAAPPDAALRAALNPSRMGPGEYTLAYLPSVGLGGVFTVEGTADCQYWVVFEKRDDATVPVRGLGGSLLGGCMRDGGSTGYLALIGGHPVALNVTNDPSLPNVTDFQWQRWLGGNKWGPARRIRFSYGYRLKPSSMNQCPKSSPRCAITAGIALSVAQRYMRDALALANPVGETRPEQTRFKQMLRQAPHRPGWGFCWNPVWFPTRLEGRIAIGGITESHIGCHPAGRSLDVAFWGIRSNGTQWWFADHTIDIERQKLLAAALVPPSKIRR